MPSRNSVETGHRLRAHTTVGANHLAQRDDPIAAGQLLNLSPTTAPGRRAVSTNALKSILRQCSLHPPGSVSTLRPLGGMLTVIWARPNS